MKRKMLVFVILLLTLCSCDNNLERETACQINATRSLDVNGNRITHSLYIDEDSSRFVWSLECPNEYNGIFYFAFSYNDIYLCNDDEFKYITSANEIVEFDSCYGDKNGYDFVGPIIIYIYYNNSSKEVKDIIDNHIYNIEIDFLKWFSKPEIF